MNTYPAFYKAVDGKEYLYLDKSNYFSFERGIWDKSDSADNHEDDTNITREYLANTKVKIESEEHSFFIQELAFKSGYIWIDGTSKNIELSGGCIVFNKGSMTINHITSPVYSAYKEIHIPLPPKEPEPKEWPQVGDEIEINRGDDWFLCKVDYVGKNNIVVTSEKSLKNKQQREHCIKIKSNQYRKPSTPEEELAEELREKLKDELSSYISRHDPYDTLIDLTDGILNGEIDGLSYNPE